MLQRGSVRNAVRPIIIPDTHVNSIDVREPDTNQPVSNIGFECTMSFANGFPYAVVIALRNGLAVTVPPITGNWSTTKDFVVYVRYRFAKDVKIDTYRLFDVIPDNASMEMKAMKVAITEAKVNIVRNGHECLLMYTVDVGTFEKHMGALYLHALDVTISTGTADRPVFHPESLQGRQLREQYAVGAGLTYHVSIVDKDRRFGKRWVNIGGRVFSVYPVHDSDKLDGIYLTTSGQDGQSKSQEIYYTFESAEAELMLFSSEAEAATLGNQVESKRREFEELQHEQRVIMLRLENDHKKSIQLMELEIAKQKQEKVDRENEWAKEVSRLKKSEYALEKAGKKREAKYAKEKAKRDAYMLAEKDYYEHRSYDRKDSSEVIKWLPAAVVGMGLLISKFL